MGHRWSCIQDGSDESEDGLTSMKIELVRTGGQGPISRRSVSLDVSQLPETEALKAQQLVASAHFFDLPEKLPSKPMPDSFDYRISVEQEGHTHTVQMNQSVVPEHVQPLVDWLMSKAQVGLHRQ